MTTEGAILAREGTAWTPTVSMEEAIVVAGELQRSGYVDDDYIPANDPKKQEASAYMDWDLQFHMGTEDGKRNAKKSGIINAVPRWS